jgi:phage terminase small subunit
MSRGNRGGRPAKPSRLHVVQGTTTRSDRRFEPRPVGDLTDPPEWMDEDQQAGWRYAIANCPPGLLKLIDRGTLALWVEAENRHRIATMTQSAINRGKRAPYVMRGPDGVLLISPYVDIIDRAAKIMFRAITELGFSPASRPRIKMDTEQMLEDVERNPWAHELRLVGRDDD